MGDFIMLEYGDIRSKWSIENSKTWFLTVDDTLRNAIGSNSMQGLCGNFDGVGPNDLRMRNGQKAKGPSEMGDSYIVRSLTDVVSIKKY